jgi:hypothetical protein
MLRDPGVRDEGEDVTESMPDRRPGQAPDRVRPATKPAVRLPTGKVVRPAPGQRVDLSEPRRAVDVCLVFDTTGSMSDKIDGLVHCMVDFVGELAKLRLAWRLTAVPFGDLTVRGDRVVDDLPFVTTREDGERLIRELPRFNGGGNVGESSLEAVMAALGKQYRQPAVKVLVLLTDEPPLESRGLNPAVVGQALAQREVICFAAAPDLDAYRRWAEQNGGQWYLIGPSMDTTALLRFFRSLVRDVAKVARAVHEVGGGSVRRYLETGRRGELPSAD